MKNPYSSNWYVVLEIVVATLATWLVYTAFVQFIRYIAPFEP